MIRAVRFCRLDNEVRVTILRIPRFLLLLTIACLVIVGFSLTFVKDAQSQAGVKMSAQAGFDVFCKMDKWFPIKVTLENTGSAILGRVETRIKSPYGDTYTYATPIDLPESSQKEFFLYVTINTYINELPIYLLDGENVIQTTSVRINCLPQSDILIGVLSATPSAYSILNNLDPELGSANVAHLALNDFPTRGQGLEALDVLFFSDVDTGILTDQQKEALALWLANGGQLFVSGGINWQKTAVGLTEFLPIRLTNLGDMSNFQALAKFCKAQHPFSIYNNAIPIARGTILPGGTTLVEEAGIPIIINRQYGLGEVYYLVFDPSTEPFKNWEGMITLYQSILAYRSDTPGWITGFSNWQMAQEAVSSPPGINLPSAIMVCSFISLYITIVGPGNYFVLRHIKKRELTWVTIPALVLVFSILTMFLGNMSRGRTPLIHQVSIVQSWPDIGLAKVDSLTGIFSPQRTTYHVEINHPSLSRPIVHAEMNGQDMTVVQNSEKLSIPGLRVDIGGVETFASSGATEAYPIENQLVLLINHSGVSLNGKVINRGDQTLEDAVLLYPGGSQNLGDFSPGGSHTVNVPLGIAQASGKHRSSTYALFSTNLNPSSSYPYPVYGYNEDPTIESILGTSNYYANKEIYERFTLLNSVLSDSDNITGRGGGIYLCGWVKEPTLDIQIIDHDSRYSSATLHLINLKPNVETHDDHLKLTPGVFVWESMADTASIRSSPYNGSIDANESQHLRFKLGNSISYTSVEELILTLEIGNTSLSLADLIISLWDFEKSQWVELENLNWGNNHLTQAEQFVGLAGTVQLSIANKSNSYYEIGRSDITLIVTP